MASPRLDAFNRVIVRGHVRLLIKQGFDTWEAAWDAFVKAFAPQKITGKTYGKPTVYWYCDLDGKRYTVPHPIKNDNETWCLSTCAAGQARAAVADSTTAHSVRAG